jgi:hypothetical protein
MLHKEASRRPSPSCSPNHLTDGRARRIDPAATDMVGTTGSWPAAHTTCRGPDPVESILTGQEDCHGERNRMESARKPRRSYPIDAVADCGPPREA